MNGMLDIVVGERNSLRIELEGCRKQEQEWHSKWVDANRRVDELERFANYRDAIFDLIIHADSMISLLHHRGYIKYGSHLCPDRSEVESLIANLRNTASGRPPRGQAKLQTYSSPI